eukprot:1665888-Pleurochrysis_carterae.AAC.1
MLPGEDGVAALLDGDDLAAWRAASAILEEHGMFGSELVSYSSLLDAAHYPPPGHDLSKAKWKCRHFGVDLFSSWEEFKAERAHLLALKERADGGDADAKKAYLKILREHAETHLDQSKFVPPVLKAGGDIFIVDALHCLQLSIAKTAWKYSYGNTEMNEYARSRATEYMESIGCYLDTRAKGQRNPEHKFMTGSTVDDFVLGKLRDVKSESPGLVINTLAFCEIVYGGNSDPPSPSTSARPTPTQPTPPAASDEASRRRPKASGTRRRPVAPSVSFRANATSSRRSLRRATRTST